jgi:hypothetical protein
MKLPSRSGRNLEAVLEAQVENLKRAEASLNGKFPRY